jgi:Tfp pilus assembly PilM family ATPase
MQRLKVLVTLKIKSDPEDTDQLEADIRDELTLIVSEESELDYRVLDEESEEDEEGIEG